MTSMNSSYSITSKFQITLPKEVRKDLNLSETDRVSFERRGNEVIVKKVPTIAEVAAEMSAKFKASGQKPATDEEIKNARHDFYEKGMKW